MPIYEYECTSCGERFEITRKFSDPPIETCAQFSCPKNQPVNKIISAPAIMFKGAGWYVTDYSDKLKDPDKKPEDKGKPVDVKNSDGQKESKTSADGSSGESKSESPKTSEGGTSHASSESKTSSESSSGSTASPSSGSSSSSSSSKDS